MSLPPFPAGTRRIFIAYLDTHYGVHMTQKLFAQQQPGSEIEVCGMVHVASNASAITSKVKRVYKRFEADAIRKALLEADLVLFELVDNTEDAVAALRLLTTNHFDVEKRFVLVSSTMTWFETPPLVDAAIEEDPAPEGDEEEGDGDQEALTEDQYNRRIPHAKYLAWRDVEKLCCSSHCERLKTFVVFSGLQYGIGEDKLHPIFKQAWSLSHEGLPIYGHGKQLIPMIHVSDLVAFTNKLFTIEELPEGRYFFAADDGNSTWNTIIKAINTSVGNGKTFRVPSHEYCLHDNVEHFIVNLKVDAQTIGAVLGEEEWVSKAGFVENVDMIATQYRHERKVTPLRIVILGPPSSGKSYTCREMASALNVPHYSIADIIADYRYQELELKEEVDRVQQQKYDIKAAEKKEEKRQMLIEEKKAAQEAEIAEAAISPEIPNEDDDDIEEEEEIEVSLTQEEEQEVREAAAEDDGDERIAQIQEKLVEIGRVLAMKLKPVGEPVVEPPNPKEKKKPANKKDKKPVQEEPEEPQKEFRFSDRALGIMVRWKLSRAECRNQGYILDGYPKTVRQARLCFEDLEIEVPEDPEEPDLPLDKQLKACVDGLFPDIVFHCKAGDSFLLERLQKTQLEHPHNSPEDFMRRLDLYKQNFEGASNVFTHFESAKSIAGKSLAVRVFDMEGCPLVPPPPAKSEYAVKSVDPIVLKIIESVGKPHNFGPTPQDMRRDAERQRLLAEEQHREQEAVVKQRKEKESMETVLAQKSKREEAVRVSQMKEAERQMLEQRKAPLKAYLMANVIPVLTKGLIDVCNKRPEDPVDHLAEWLFRHNPEDHPDMYA